jgi:hypothetical protein
MHTHSTDACTVHFQTAVFNLGQTRQRDKILQTPKAQLLQSAG